MESKNTIRMDANFSDGKPHGRYQIFYHHPKGKQLTALNSLKKKGVLRTESFLKNQTSYYPRTYALIVVLPSKKRLDQKLSSKSNRFSHAIDDAKTKNTLKYLPTETQIIHLH